MGKRIGRGLVALPATSGVAVRFLCCPLDVVAGAGAKEEDPVASDETEVAERLR